MHSRVVLEQQDGIGRLSRAQRRQVDARFFVGIWNEQEQEGTPVVAANTGSLPEIVGDAGFLVEPDDVNRMAGAIIASLIDEPMRKVHREKGLARAATFSWEKCARETAEVYRQALR